MLTASSPKEPPSGLTPLQVAALAIYTEGPRHPYEVHALMRRRREDLIVKLRAGSLYHAIARLAAAGHLTAIGTDRAGNRPERTTYAITESGRGALVSWVLASLRTREPEFPAYLLAVGELHSAPRDEVLAALAARVAELDADVADLDEGLRVAAAKGVAHVHLLDVHLLRALAGAERDWTAHTLEGLRDGSIAWADPGDCRVDTAGNEIREGSPR